VDDGGVLRTGCLERQGRRGRRWRRRRREGRGMGWMARCLLPIPLSPRHSCVCLYEDLSNSSSTPSPSPSAPPPLVAPVYPPPPFHRRGPRVMIVFAHLEDEVSQLLSFLVSIPDAADASSQNALSPPAVQWAKWVRERVGRLETRLRFSLFLYVFNPERTLIRF